MTYRIIVTARANQELLEDAIWWAEHRDSDQANHWLDGFQVALRALAQTADKQPMAEEYGELPGELRQMPYGLGRKPTHRAVFEIRGQEVIVHAIRHLARKDLTAEDLDG
jgi:plasmid stabilization system protein ParE